MRGENDNENIYDETVDTSMEMSIQKAMAIFAMEQEKERAKLVRPNIVPLKGILIGILFLGLIGGLAFVLSLVGISPLYALLVGLVIVLVFAKRIVIWMILVYQKCAPERIRRSCVFEPSCSNYMLMAIEKYGLIKGVFKGIKRLFRCHPPNGGVDNP